MGKHARPSHAPRHRKPSAPYRAAAVTASAATATASAGAIVAIASSGHAATLPQPQLAAHVIPSVQAPQLHVINVQQPAAVVTVTVEKGNTLSGIAAEHCGTVSDWTGIYLRNRKTIGSDYNLIQVGQELALDCRTVNVPVVTTTDSYVRRVRVSVARPYHRTYHRAYGYSGNVNPGSYSGFQACVIARESSGNSQVMNSSGHYGLYQFSADTWKGHGGNPADFGHASVAEQTQVFWNTVRADGTSDWSPYDGCV